MSLVGPRPEAPYYVEQFKEEVPLYMVKHQVRPGITGWAQVNGLPGTPPSRPGSSTTSIISSTGACSLTSRSCA